MSNTVTNKPGWIYDKPVVGSFFPHHRRWSCRLAMIAALRNLDSPVQASASLARAVAFNAIMFDCEDPLAACYAGRLAKISKKIDAALRAT